MALIAHYFFLSQRKLQQKVVSDFSWTAFLGKGQGAILFQNNLNTKPSPEHVLAEIAGFSVTPEKNGQGVMGNIKQTRLLMKEYVDVYGQGQRESVHQLKEDAKGQGLSELPDPVHKFLAKDIMHWNNTLGDDAFANGKIPGWEVWLRERSLL